MIIKNSKRDQTENKEHCEIDSPCWEDKKKKANEHQVMGWWGRSTVNLKSKKTGNSLRIQGKQATFECVRQAKNTCRVTTRQKKKKQEPH